ncbi:MAG: N-acetyl-gamma-glutamyl-phosphate reductase [Syntrophomonadaceae bacterium]|nr:N-acetyl-gamma-glutamyl-phosphate reductase [Syntrophomonadaceae bacterium]
MYRIGIVGDGYTAADLLRIISGHEEVEAVTILSTENIGKKITDVYPSLLGFSDLVCQESNIENLAGKCDAVFLALPHGLSVPMATQLMEYGIKCIDLGADFRFNDSEIYNKYYNLTHANPQLLKEAVYGIPELYREQIKAARLVANPGCFPTSAILPLVPLLAAGIIETNDIIIDSKTGVSGAGRTPSPTSHFCAVNENINAYGVGTHRHAPEIAQELSLAAGSPVDITFTPHLVPMNRGILSTIYARLRPGLKGADVRQVLNDKYGQETFIRILPEGVMPHTKWVYGSNLVHINLVVDESSRRVILLSALDNLTKGASGQAVQNMNLMLGIEESRALNSPAVFP